MNKIINIYYKEFESFGVFWKLRNLFFTFSIIALVFFFIGVLSLFGFIDISKKYQISKDSIFNFLLFSEICVLLSFKGMEEQRNNHIKKKYREIYRKELTLHEIKRKWFENTIDLPFYEYANLAEKIEKFYLIEEKYSKPSLSRH